MLYIKDMADVTYLINVQDITDMAGRDIRDVGGKENAESFVINRYGAAVAFVHGMRQRE